MESLSRHPLRRKDSATNGRVSSKTPFKDVGFSNWDRGKGKVFEARDYAEIFAGSSSIPVFDVSSLDERVESSEFRASNLDYSDVFGVMRNYDVAVAFEELLHHFDGSAKESNPCAAADRFMSSRDSGPRHSMMNGKRVSDKVPNHSADQDKEQFSMSFSGAHQQNANVSDKKKEEAYATDVRPRFSPKYEVNRAWSFTVQVESLNNKSQLNSRKSSDLNEVECGTQASNMPQTSSLNVSESSVKVLEQAKTSSLDSEGDISEVSAGEFSRPFFVEGYDEKSPAATSAAALKKAVDDAREKIRQAKFMMERRKKGNGDRSTRRQKIRTDQVANDSSESKSVNKDENSDPVFTPSAKYIDLVLNAGEGKTTKNVGMEKHGKNVERIEVCTKTTQFTGSNANEECRTLPGNIDVDCRFVPSGTVLASCADKLENGNGNSASVHNVKEPEAVVDKQSPRLSKEKMEVEKMVEEADQSSSNTIQVNDSGNVSETESIHASQKDQELGKVFDIAVENLRISLEDQGVNQGDKHSDGLGRENEKLCDFVVNEVPEKGEVGELVLSISEVVHKPSSSQEELEIRLESNYQRDGNLEKKINNDPVMLQETEEVVRVNDFMQTEMDCKKQADGGDVNQPELFRKCDEFEAEEIKLDTFVHEWVATNAADCSHFRNAFAVHDVATEYSVEDAAGREDDQKFSATQETEFKSFTVESIHVSRSDSDLHRKAEEYEEAIRSSTGIHTTTSEIIGAYSMFYKEVEHEKLEQKRDPISEAQSLHQITSEENHAESKVCNGLGGVSDSLIYSAGPVENEQVGVDASKTTPLIPDASRNSAADVLKAPVVDSRTRGINLGQVRNSEEQTPDCRSSSPATCVQDYADGLSGSESEGSKQGTTSAQEELKDKSGMVDEAVSDEGSCNANSDVDAKQTNGTEKYAETNLEMQKDKDFVGEKGAKESFPPNFVENDQQQRIEAIRKGREREKDRLAVERAIREARERAKEKLERAAAEKQQAEKAATEAKLRAERAAVERATAEARERAFEKAKSLKTFTTTRSLAAEKIPMPSRNDGLKHSFSSSDLEVVATYTESAQRRKARLERHQRVMERAAKALEEKNKRDLLVQKEQAERNRMAEFLDADIKRWSAGKEGNLRALLSTLHYILSAESGWRAVSLTEIITTADVKKAYRKATLCVHPDKLQQRGASVQQKYICEKVFDLLKAAWNKFNSEER